MNKNELDAVAEGLIEDFQAACLDEVLTVREAMGMFRKGNKTIIELIKAGKLIGRQARVGAIWLVSLRSCEERWGKAE